jgi:hypothetical protein
MLHDLIVQSKHFRLMSIWLKKNHVLIYMLQIRNSCFFLKYKPLTDELVLNKYSQTCPNENLWIMATCQQRPDLSHNDQPEAYLPLVFFSQPSA